MTADDHATGASNIRVDNTLSNDANFPPVSVTPVIVPNASQNEAPWWFYIVFILVLLFFLFVTSLLFTTLTQTRSSIPKLQPTASPTVTVFIQNTPIPTIVVTPTPQGDTESNALRILSPSDSLADIESDINGSVFTSITEALNTLDAEHSFKR
jgi:hypothetical protein